MKAASLTLLGILLVGCGGKDDYKPPPEPIEPTDLAIGIPARIAVEPPMFNPDQLITVNTSFGAPVACATGNWMVLRIYNVDKTTNEPIWGEEESTKYMVHISAPFDNNDAPPGTSSSVSFGTLSVPAEEAGHKLKFMVFSVCSSTYPQGDFTTDGDIIDDTNFDATFVASANFVVVSATYKCTGTIEENAQSQFCKYRPE